MKSIFPLLLPLLTGPLAAQDITPKDSERDPVLSALLEASAANDNPSSVVVNLTAETESEPPSEEIAILTNGSPPKDPDLLPPSPEPAKEPKGVHVEIEAGSSNADIDPSLVKLVAPFPARPLAHPPRGWRLIHPEQIEPLSESVSLANGNEITLSIRPHVLVPDADGIEVFALSEPGFDHSLQYAQSQTIGSVLADSIMSLDEHSDRLENAAQRLEELLQSLPSPPPAAKPVPEK